MRLIFLYLINDINMTQEESTKSEGTSSKPVQEAPTASSKKVTQYVG